MTDHLVITKCAQPGKTESAIHHVDRERQCEHLAEFSRLILQQAELHCGDVAEVECTEMRKTYIDSENTTFTFTPNRLREFVRVLFNVSIIQAIQQDEKEEH